MISTWRTVTLLFAAIGMKGAGADQSAGGAEGARRVTRRRWHGVNFPRLGSEMCQDLHPLLMMPLAGCGRARGSLPRALNPSTPGRIRQAFTQCRVRTGTRVSPASPVPLNSRQDMAGVHECRVRTGTRVSPASPLPLNSRQDMTGGEHCPTKTRCGAHFP